MKKRIIIGDMHGRYDAVEKIYNKENPDSVIILGDYVDSHEVGHKSIKKSITKLIELKNNHTKGEFILLWGNHDFHYLVNDRYERYSGWNSTTNFWAHPLFREWRDTKYAQFCYIDYINKTIYSHAGVSNAWLNETCPTAISHPDAYTIEEINNMYIYNFSFESSFAYNIYGDTKWNGPLWIRPQSLSLDAYKDTDGYTWNQIVGHTQVKTPTWIDINNEDKILLIDCINIGYVVEILDDNGKLISRNIITNY